MPMLILRKGENIFEASEEWWPANCMFCGALFKYKNDYLICSGKTPAVVYVSLSALAISSVIPLHGFVE